jgi:hypothetical protein
MSTAYRPLFSIVVQHDFFAPGAVGDFKLVPSTRCAALLDKFGILLRNAPGGVELFCQQAERDELRAGLGVEPDMALGFRGYASDPQFSTFTELGPRTMEQSVFVDRADGPPDPDGRICLHPGPLVDGTCLRKNDSPALAEMLGRNFDPVKPVFFANIEVRTLVNALQQSPSGDAAAPVFYLRFAARTSVWKYFFLNDVGSKDIAIVDLDGRTRFSRRGITALPGQRSAVTFVSDEAIAMQKTYPQRFQLREQGALGERILIKRLPNANVNAIGREVPEGSAVAVLVSEIYIN